MVGSGERRGGRGCAAVFARDASWIVIRSVFRWTMFLFVCFFAPPDFSPERDFELE